MWFQKLKFNLGFWIRLNENLPLDQIPKIIPNKYQVSAPVWVAMRENTGGNFVLVFSAKYWIESKRFEYHKTNGIKIGYYDSPIAVKKREARPEYYPNF